MSQALVELETPVGTLADEFDVFVRRHGEDDDAWVHHGSSRGPKFLIGGLPSTGHLEIGLGWRLNGTLVTPDLWTILPYQCGDPEEFDVPSDITGFGVGQEGGHLRFVWQAVDVAFLSHYEIRRCGTFGAWDEGLWIADVPAPNTTFVVGWMASGTHIYAIKAVTLQGRKSAFAGAASIVVREDGHFMAHVTTTEATAFGATKTGCEVVSNTLRPTTHPASYANKSLAYTAYTDPWWYPTGRRPTYVTGWIDAGAVMDEKVEVDLAFTSVDFTTSYAEYLYPHDAEFDDVTGTAVGPGTRRPGHLRAQDGKSVDGTRFRIEIDTSQDSTPTPEGFRDWVPGTVYRFWKYRLRVTFLNDWPWMRPAIATLTHKMKRRNLKDEQVASVVGTGGTSVTWATPFQVAPKVVATVIGTSAQFAVASSISTSGCTIQVFAHDGAEVGSATVHVVAAGV